MADLLRNGISYKSAVIEKITIKLPDFLFWKLQQKQFFL